MTCNTLPAYDYIERPFCQGLLGPKTGKQMCPECNAQLEIDDRLESIFVDTSDLRLSVNGTVCPSCGLVEDERVNKCWYCGVGLFPTVQ